MENKVNLKGKAKRVKPAQVKNQAFVPVPLISQQQLAARLNCTVVTIRNYRKAGMPVAVSLNNRPRFIYSDCIAWLQKRGK